MNIKKVGKVLLIGLIVVVVCGLIIPNITYQKKILPNGTMITMNRFNKQISFRRLNSNVFYIINLSGDVMVKDMKDNEELYSFSSIVYSNIYKHYFNILKYD